MSDLVRVILDGSYVELSAGGASFTSIPIAEIPSVIERMERAEAEYYKGKPIPAWALPAKES